MKPTTQCQPNMQNNDSRIHINIRENQSSKEQRDLLPLQTSDAAADSKQNRSGTEVVELQTRMKQGQVLKLTTQRGGVPGLLHKSADLQWISDPPTGHR